MKNHSRFPLKKEIDYSKWKTTDVIPDLEIASFETEYYTNGRTKYEFYIHPGIEWNMATTLGLEVEYATIVLTHETIHAVIDLKMMDKKIEDYPEELIHVEDVCALLGF
jgi:hypothetical protein